MRAVSALTVAAAAYLSFLLAAFFLPPYIPRFRLEGVFMIFVASAVALVWLRGPSTARTGLASVRPSGWAAMAGAGVAFAVIAVLLYAPALGVGLLSDDFVITGWASRGVWVYQSDVAFARTAVPMLWSGVLALPGADTLLHAVNIVLHALNALLVVVLASRWRMPREQALAAGLLFVLWPGLTEALVWASGVHDVLMTTGVLLALVCTLRADGHVGWAVGALAASILAVGAKETGAVAPVLGWAVWWSSTPRPRGSRPVWTLTAMTVVAAAYAVARVSMGVPDAFGREIDRYFVKQLLIDPFAALGAPWSADWARAHAFVGLQRAWVIVALVFVAAFSWDRDAPGLRRALVSASWVTVGVLPAFALFHVGADLQGARYLYLPAAGFALLLAALTGAAARAVPGYLATPLLGALVVALALPSASAIPDETARWSDAARVRDAILAEATVRPAMGRCASFVAEGMVDEVSGAYVFRNGLLEALGGAPGRLGVVCHVGWVDGRLVVRPEE